MRNKAAFLLFRWVMLGILATLTLSTGNWSGSGYALIETLAAVAVYNGVFTVYSIRNNGKIPLLIIYADVLAVSFLAYFSGGVRSEAYIILFFLLGCCGILKDASNTSKVTAVTIIAYSASCILAAGTAGKEPAYLLLIGRDLLLIMGAICISCINFEVAKSDELRKKEFKIARTDKLTGLANRHYFDQKLREEVEYANRNGTTLNVIIFDIDNFKGFNDTFGHLSGDKLLMLFSDIIVQCIRKSDIPVRYGGEEFLILIRELDLVVARSVADRIRKQLEKQRIYIGSPEDKKKVSVSCGIAQYPTHSGDIKEVLEMADQALYYAKGNGKNMVVTFDELPKKVDFIS